MTLLVRISLLWLGYTLLYTQLAAATELRVAVPYSMPPYASTDTKSGIVVDIIAHTLQRTGHQSRFDFLPNNRLSSAFERGTYDVSFGIPVTLDSEQVYFSDALLNFENMAISLSSSAFTIERIDDLAGKRIIAFRNAAKFLGPAFSKLVHANPQYAEVTKQQVQLQLLLKGRTDVVIMERRIFRYFAKALGTRQLQGQRFVEHPLFDIKERLCAFRDKALRDKFDLALADFKKTPKYSQLLNH
ncbi:MAG: substrate-binding periplasmic protein [Pseudomonadales bacterium]